MNVQESFELKEFIKNRIYPEFGRQPSRLRYWDKNALRILYADYLKPHYLFTHRDQKLGQLIDEVQKKLEYD